MNSAGHPAWAAAYADARTMLALGRTAHAEAVLRALARDRTGECDVQATLGRALVQLGRAGEAVTVLEAAHAGDPAHRAVRIELCRAYTRTGSAAAGYALLEPVLAGGAPVAAWFAAGDALVELGRSADALAAFEHARRADPYVSAIDRARAALVAKDRRSAEGIFRDILRRDPAHVGALCGLAAVSLASGIPADAKRLLRHAQAQCRHLPLTLRGLAQALLDDGDLADAEATMADLLVLEPENAQNWVTQGTILTRLMRPEDALAAFSRAAELEPAEPGLRLSIGHLCKTVGRRADCEAAYRQCLSMDPSFGEAYWGLADLKNYDFADADIAAMRSIVVDPASPDARRTQVHFALGRALENRGDHDAAFGEYARGNALRRAATPFSIAQFEDKARRVREVFDAGFLARHAGHGTDDPAPLFIVGLPRSGSTLVEQILASHPAVEGTFELPNVLRIVREIDHRHPGRDGYPEGVAAFTADAWRALGARYIDETRPLRSGRAHFIDKMPNNFSHAGLIHTMLPRATIIDVRRHPLDACFSTYKQYFAEGQSFSYDLSDLGRYYRAYLGLMDHWHAALPGRVLTVHYEALVRDPQTQIRSLLAHCGLPFDPACLAFHQTRRAVRTASAEQVRQPLYTRGIDYWRHYERHLGALIDALGDAVPRVEREIDAQAPGLTLNIRSEEDRAEPRRIGPGTRGDTQ